MSTTDNCGVCGAQDSWRHSLLDCTLSRSIWALSNEDMVQHMSMNRCDNAREWLFSMFESLPKDELVTMIVTLWAIWAARRKLIHEGIFQTPFATHGFISSYLSELQFLEKPEKEKKAPAPRPTQWIPPPDNHMKFNVDIAVARHGGFGTVSAICRDGSGEYQGASVIRFNNVDDPETLDTLAIREALALAEDLLFHDISVASDCKVAVEAIKRGTSAQYGAVVHEIIDRSRVFSSCLINHEFRTSNVEAHKLAKHALSLGFGRHVWLGHPGNLDFVLVNICDG
ncbi:hypothetical protein ACQJBY_072279 [Aegilops geniculata]